MVRAYKYEFTAEDSDRLKSAFSYHPPLADQPSTHPTNRGGRAEKAIALESAQVLLSGARRSRRGVIMSIDDELLLNHYLARPAQFRRLEQLLRSEIHRHHRECGDAAAIARLFPVMFERLLEQTDALLTPTTLRD